MRHRRIPLLLLIVGLLAGGVVFAAADGLVQFVLTGGGGRSEVDTSVLRGSVGQAIAGRGAGGDGVLCAGWPGCQSVTSSLPAPLLLVDDDDNTPDARPDYETVLNALDVRYHVWDTGGADNEPDAATLAAYQAVIWFSGANAGPYAGPGPAAESALAAWLDGGGCLFITAQDAIYRGGSGTVTPFMQSYLGLSPTSGQEVDYSIVQGQGSQFGGLGPFTFGTPLPYTAAVDELLPDGTADTALVGSGAGEAYSAAVSKDGGAYRTTFWGFPLDFLARADQRAALNTILDWCQVDIPVAGLAASNDSPTVLGQTTAFSATISAGTLVSYTWDFGDGHFGSGQTATHDYAATGTYTATVTAGNALNSQFAETTVVVAEPIAGLAAASDSPTALGQSTAFTATLGAGAGVGVEYTWDFGDGHIGAGATTSHLYELPGNYLAQVTAINPVSSQTAQTAVDVLRPVSGLEAASSSPTALGAGTAFTATVSGGDDLVYEWEFGDGAGAFGAMANHTYAASGTYTATVTATNSVSGQSADVPITVIEGVGGLTASSDSPTVLGQSTTLTATVTAGDDLVYSWDFGDGLGDSGAVLAHTYAAAGTYTATVTVENLVSSGTASTLVTVVEAIAGLTAGNDGPTPLGAATNFTATVSSAGVIDYSWDFGDGNGGSGATPSHTYAAAGIYTATVTAENQVSSEAAETTVQVVAPLMADFSATPTRGAPPLTIAFTNLSTGPLVSCYWDFGDGGSGELCADPEHTYQDTGSYTVTLTVEGGGQSDTLIKEKLIQVSDGYFVYLPLLLQPGTVDKNGPPVSELSFWPDLYLDGRRPPAGGWLP